MTEKSKKEQQSQIEGVLRTWQWRDHFYWRERKEERDGENSVTEEFCNLCSLPNSTRAIKSRKMGWDRHI